MDELEYDVNLEGSVEEWRTLELEALNASPMIGTGTFSPLPSFSLRRI